MSFRRITMLMGAAALTAIFALPAAADESGPNVADALGGCATPQAAAYTVLYWLQPEHLDPGRAAACVDREGMEMPGRDAPQFAEQLKKILDVKGLYVLWEDIPNDPEYANEAGAHEFELYPSALGNVTIVRQGTRWMFPPEVVVQVATLYRETVPAEMEDLIEAMPEWLRGRIIGFQGWQILGLVLLTILALGVKRIVLWLFGGWIRRIARRVPGKWLTLIVEKADRPVGGIVMTAIFALVLPLLQFPVRLNAIAMLALRVWAAFSVVWLGYRLVDVLAEALGDRAARTDTKLDDQLVPLLRKSLKVVLVVIGSIFILQNLSIDVGSLLAGLGLGGLAFALAAQDTVANFFGSMMIFIDKPFQIGDWVKMTADIEGTVEEVGFRTTRIRTFYNSLVTVPNAMLTNQAIDNLGQRAYRRYKTMLGLTYDTSPEKVQAFCEGVRAIIAALPGMRRDFYMVEFHGYGAHSLDVLVYCFMQVPDWSTELRTRTNLNLEVLRLSRDLGVSFAFPTQTLHIESMRAAEATTTDAPLDLHAMATVVRAFGPQGVKAMPDGFEISEGFDANAAAGVRGDADG